MAKNIIPRIFLTLMLCGMLLATLPYPSNPGVQAQQESRNVDVVLLIDNSGSMKASDPNGLRWSAAHLFVDLAAQGDRIAAFTFASTITPLGDAANSTFTTISDVNSREGLKGSIKSVPPGDNTDMSGALDAALQLFEKNASGNPQYIIFLTDGTPTVNESTLPQFIKQCGGKKIVVFPILLGANAAKDVALQMERDTGGISQNASADDLPRAFGRIYAFIRPDRYVQELPLSSLPLSFRTNPWQAVTHVAMVIPRSNKAIQAINAATLEKEDLLKQSTLSAGAQIRPSQSDHYQMISVEHNAPLNGEWVISTASGGTGLMLATSAITLDMSLPPPSIASSLVSRRLVPAGRPVFVVARALQNGVELANQPLQVNAEGAGLLALNPKGLSSNRTTSWQFLDLKLKKPGDQKRVYVQIGPETSPFQLRKLFNIEAADVPPLVIDSPSTTNSGVNSAGKLKVAAHFEGNPVSAPQMSAHLMDLQSETVTVIDLTCTENICQDESFTPESGKSYQVLVLGNATFNGMPYSDGARSELITSDLALIDGLDALANTGELAPHKNPPPAKLNITAFLQSGQPNLTATLEIQPMPPGLDPKSIGASLAPLISSGKTTYASELRFFGFEKLPEGAYKVVLTFSSPSQPNIIIQPARVEFQFRITLPEVRFIDLPTPISFDIVPDLRKAVTSPLLNVAFSDNTPFEITARVADLSSTAGKVDPALIQVDISPPQPGEKGQHTVTMRLSALQPLQPGEYRGTVQLFPANPANPAKVNPTEAKIVFSIPTPALTLDHVGLPGEPDSCPELGLQTIDPQLVDFGVVLSVDRPTQVDLYYKSVWVNTPPKLDAQTLSLRRAGKSDGLSVPASLATGSLQSSGSEGMHILPITIDLPEGQSTGSYFGKLAIKSPNVNVQPAELPMRFELRNTLWGAVLQWLRPSRCFMVDWFTLYTPNTGIRPKAILGWLASLILAFIAITIFFSVTGIGSISGRVIGPDGKTLQLTGRSPVYIAPDESGGFKLTRDRPAAVAEVTLSETVEKTPEERQREHRAHLSTRKHSTTPKAAPPARQRTTQAVCVRPIGVGSRTIVSRPTDKYKPDGSPVWTEIKPGTRAKLGNGDQFSVRVRKQERHIFSIEL